MFSFPLTNNKYKLSAIKVWYNKTYSNERYIFYSVSLILKTSGILDGILDENENKKWLYNLNLILSKLQENYSLIKKGGHLDIYYVASSELEANVKEGYRDEVGGGEGNLANYTDTDNKKLIPSKSEVITLNKVINNKLTVNIDVFTCDTLFQRIFKFFY